MSKHYEEEKRALQGIFDLFFEESVIGRPAKSWLYYVRVDVESPADAEAKCRELSRREGRPARVRIEDWNIPAGEHNGFTFETK